MTTQRIHIVQIIALTSLCFAHAAADDRVSVRSLGMGRAAAASVRGIDAVGVNPANLALADAGRFQINIAPTWVSASTELFSYDIFHTYFMGTDSGNGVIKPKNLTESDKTMIRDQMSSLPATRLSFESMLGGVSLRLPVFGAIGFAVIEHAGMQLQSARDYFDLFYLEGIPENKTYVFDGTGADAWWYREYNASYGRRIPVEIPFLQDIEGGVGIKLIQGFGIFQTLSSHGFVKNQNAVGDTGSSSVSTSIDYTSRRAGVSFFEHDSKESITPFPTPAGKGFGIDFGFSAQWINGMRTALSVTDIGSIRWNRNVVETSSKGNVKYTSVDNDLTDTVKSILKGTNRAGDAFFTALPTVLHIGVTGEAKSISFLKRIPGSLLLSFEYAQGLNEQLGNTAQARFSFGFEYRFIPILVLRSGVMLGGDTHTNWTCGFSLDFRYLSVDAATDSFGMLFARSHAYALSAAVGMKIRI